MCFEGAAAAAAAGELCCNPWFPRWATKLLLTVQRFNNTASLTAVIWLICFIFSLGLCSFSHTKVSKSCFVFLRLRVHNAPITKLQRRVLSSVRRSESGMKSAVKAVSGSQINWCVLRVHGTLGRRV